MPPVGAALGGLLSIFGGAGLSFGGIGIALAKVAAGIGLSYAARALAGKPDDLLGAGSRPTGIQAELTVGDSLPRSFMVGRWATAGQVVFMRAWGETNKVPHAYLVQVIKLSDLPITSVSDVFVNGEKIGWQDGSGGRGYAVPQYRKNGIDYLWIKVHRGDQGAADDYLTSKFADAGSNRDWDLNHRGLGVAYAIVTSRYSEKLHAGRPECLFVVNGAKLYDPTQDTTVGGSGSHRWGQPATYTHTGNPMVIIYNLMRGISFDGRWVYGLQTVGQAQLPFASWAAAIAECNLIVTNKDGSTNPQYRCGAEISWNTEVGSEIAELLKCCNGKIADCGGIYKPKVGPDLSIGSPVFTFTDDSLVITDEHEFAMFPSLDDTINGVDATFIAPGDGWQEKALPPRRREAYVDQDDKRENAADISYNHVWDKAQAQRLSKSILNESRRFRRHVIVLPPDAYLLEPLDFVQWTSDRNGYTDKLFRVESIADRNNGDQVVGLQEVDPTDYNWTPSTDEIDVPDSVQIVDRAPPQSIVSFTAVGSFIDGGTSIDRPSIHMTWNGSDLDDITGVKFEVRFLSEIGPLVVQDQMTAPESGVYDLTAGLASGTVYAVRAIYVSPVPTRDFAWTPWVSVTTAETPIFIEAFADELQDLINASSASGKVITEQVLPTPAGFQNLYRITVYGTGANAGTSAGYYLFVDSAGVPGALLDVTQVAIGSLTTRQFPFVIEGGVVKIKRANIQALQAAQISAGQILAGHLGPGSVTAAAILNGIIDASKIKPLSLDTTVLADDAVTGAKVAPLTITADLIQDAAIIATKIAAGAIIASKIAAGQILANHIAAGQIKASHIGAGQISAGHIVAGSIQVSHIGPVFKLPGSKIADLAILAGHIQSNQVEARHLYADTIDAKKIQAKHFRSNEVSTRYYSGAVSDKIASIEVKRTGAILLIGTFGYECPKDDTLEMIITRKGGSEPIGNAKFKIKPGDDIKKGAAQVITLIDQTQTTTNAAGERIPVPQVYELKPSSANTARTSSLRIIALRVSL